MTLYRFSQHLIIFVTLSPTRVVVLIVSTNSLLTVCSTQSDYSTDSAKGGQQFTLSLVALPSL